MSRLDGDVGVARIAGPGSRGGVLEFSWSGILWDRIGRAVDDKQGRWGGGGGLWVRVCVCSLSLSGPISGNVCVYVCQRRAIFRSGQREIRSSGGCKVMFAWVKGRKDSKHQLTGTTALDSTAKSMCPTRPPDHRPLPLTTASSAPQHQHARTNRRRPGNKRQISVPPSNISGTCQTAAKDDMHTATASREQLCRGFRNEK
jgi:hypothetical protein